MIDAWIPQIPKEFIYSIQMLSQTDGNVIEKVLKLLDRQIDIDEDGTIVNFECDFNAIEEELKEEISEE